MFQKSDCVIVEDDQDNMFICEHIMESLGFRSHGVQTAEEALSVCNSRAPRLIILDWNLPGQSGIEFLEEIRQTPVGEISKIVMCTAQNDLPSVKMALERGADGYIVKPYKRDAFAKQLSALGLLSVEQA